MASRLQSCSQIRLSAQLPLMPHLIKGGVMAGPPQAARSSEHPALLSAAEEPLYMEMSPRRSGPPSPARPASHQQQDKSSRLLWWKLGLDDSTTQHRRASKLLLTLLDYKLHVPGRVNPRPHINTLSGLLMIYTRLCCSAGGGRGGWEAARFSWQTAATGSLWTAGKLALGKTGPV